MTYSDLVSLPGRASVALACGKDSRTMDSIRDLGTVSGYRLFGCGYGIHPNSNYRVTGTCPRLTRFMFPAGRLSIARRALTVIAPSPRSYRGTLTPPERYRPPSRRVNLRFLEGGKLLEARRDE
jgi:hypothetical protein